ncbi:alanyl-tRNA editing protein [Erysipelotrichaceae bacterium OttesenSCG-928-M19]|nr:alanyl-tRNA editing protein [Erysipelotrichaceae bacterium OttesenSCG-928-M19]
MQTKILYYDDIKLLNFEATIISYTKEKDGYHTILSQTAFYPESGGMSCDLGLIDNIKVTKVIKKNDEIIHILEQEPTNTVVKGQVDAYTRHTNIQIHDAQHLLTAIFEKDYDLMTVSHHVHGDYCDLVLAGEELTPEIMAAVEQKANQLILENRKLDIFMVAKSELHKYNLEDNPKYSDPVRITNIETLDDFNACGCLHFDNVSQIQAVKCLSVEKTGKDYKLLFTAGLRMIAYFEVINDVFKELKFITKANEDTLVEKTQGLIDKGIALTKELNDFKTKYYQMELAAIVAKSTDNFIYYQQPDNNFEDLKIMANAIINSEQPLKGLLQIKKDDKYQFILVKQKDLTYPLEELFARLKNELKINGGGKGLMITGQAEQDLSEVIKQYL